MGCRPEVNGQSSILPLTDIVTGTQNTSRFKYVYFIVQLKVHFICMRFLLNTGQWKLLPRKYIFRAHRQPSNFDHLAMLHTVTIVPLSHIEAVCFGSIIVWLIHRPIGVDNSLPRVWTELSSGLPNTCQRSPTRHGLHNDNSSQLEYHCFPLHCRSQPSVPGTYL